MIASGLGLTGWGVRAALTRPRPISLAASALAAVGLGLALFGVVTLAA
jgi:hypothetical protein